MRPVTRILQWQKMPKQLLVSLTIIIRLRILTLQSNPLTPSLLMSGKLSKKFSDPTMINFVLNFKIPKRYFATLSLNPLHNRLEKHLPGKTLNGKEYVKSFPTHNLLARPFSRKISCKESWEIVTFSAQQHHQLKMIFESKISFQNCSSTKMAFTWHEFSIWESYKKLLWMISFLSMPKESQSLQNLQVENKFGS